MYIIRGANVSQPFNTDTVMLISEKKRSKAGKERKKTENEKVVCEVWE